MNKIIINTTEKMVYGSYAVTMNGEIKYIGSGDICDCISRHKSHLKRNDYIGTNKQCLQDAYNNNPNSIDYIVLDYVSNNVKDINIVNSEIYFFNLYRKQICNKNKPGRPMRDYGDFVGRTKENIKRTMSNTGENNPHWSGKLTLEDVVRIKILLFEVGMKNRDVYQLFKDKTSDRMISRIKTGDRYKNVNIEDFNDISVDDLCEVL